MSGDLALQWPRTSPRPPGRAPLEAGLDGTGLVVVLVASAVLTLVAVLAHDRRDLGV